MKVSVVIPVYNEERYIEACLTRMFSQEVLPDEVIIVNNNCTDETVKIASQFPVRIVKEKNQGIAWARNKGYDLARYNIIARTDADTYVSKTWIKEIKKQFFDNPSLDAITGPLIFREFYPHTTLPAKLFLEIMRVIQGGETFIAPNMALRKSIWKKVKDRVCLDDSKVHEDIDLALSILSVGGKIKYDYSLVVEESARRVINNPFSFFCEYPFRTIKTIRRHKKLFSIM